MSRSSVVLLVAFLTTCFASAQTSPAIEITSIPAFGAPSGILSGRLTGANPAAFKVAILVYVPGRGYFIKPTCAQPTVALNVQGMFSALITTGEGDSEATLIAVLAMPIQAVVQCPDVTSQPGIPPALERAAVAKLVLQRPNPLQREITFAGETWLVKSASVTQGPHSNWFSASDENVFVDGLGRLHLRITNRDGKWYSAEVISKRPVGYGQYSVTVESSPIFDRNIVFGGFTYAEGDPLIPELDLLEIGKFDGPAGDPTNAQYVVQPFDIPGSLRRLTLPSTAPQTHTMTWEPDRAHFKSANSTGGTIDEWQYTGKVPKADTDDTRFRLNFWLHNGSPPTNNQGAEIIISNVSLPQRPGERLVSVAPLTGAGITQTFTAVFRHPGGASTNYLGYLLLLPSPNIVWFTAAGSCLVEYNRISSRIRLINEAGNDWIEGGVIRTPGASVSNSRCSVDVAAATAILSGNDMIVTYPITFKPAGMSLVLGSFLQSLDVTGAWTDMRQFGNWVLPGAPVKPGPAIHSVVPANATGNNVTYTLSAGHTSGVSSLGEVHLLFGNKIVGGSPCQVVYFATNNRVNLINATGTALVSATNIPIGTATVLDNGLCAVNVGGSSRAISGNTLSVTIPMTFNSLQYSGSKNVYANAFDITGQLSHWVQAASLNVP